MKNHAARTSVRERLLQTADQLFYTEGLHAVGIDRIIAESGVAKSTMYVYFRTKEDLIVEYLRQRSNMTRERITAAVEARADQSVCDRILTDFDVLDDMISEPGFRGCAFVNAAAEYPSHQGIREAITADRRWLPRLLTRLLEEANAAEPGLVDELVQLYDGANVMAHLDRSNTSAKTARRVAEQLIAPLFTHR